MVFFVVYNLPPRHTVGVNRLFTGILSVYLITEVLGIKMYQFVVTLMQQNIWLGIMVYVAIILLCLLAGFLINFFAKLIVSKVPSYKIELFGINQD